MTEIFGLNNNILLNSSPIQAKVKELTSEVSLEQAKALTKNRKDGYDTIGGKLEGKDVIILAKYPKGIQNSDQIQIGGKRLQVAFVENEANTKGEFLSNAIPSTALSSLVLGTIVANIKAGMWEPVTPKAILVSSVAVAAVMGTGVYFSSKHLENSHNEKITNSISQ